MQLRDELAMTEPEGNLDDIRRRFEAVTGVPDEPPVDLRAYLLDPPPTAEEQARRDRQRTLVRRGSIAASALIAIVLLAPWPSTKTPTATAEPAADVQQTPTTQTPELPVRVDVPASRPRAASRRVDRPPRREARSTRVITSRSERPSRAPAAPAPPAAAPVHAPARSVPAQPTNPAAPGPAPPLRGEPVPGADAGVLTPVM